MNKFLIFKIFLSILLVLSFIIKLNYNILHWRHTILDIVYFSLNLINLMIIWIRKPFFWYAGLLMFSTGVFYAIQFNFLHIDSNNIPSIMSTKPLYHYFKELNINIGICNIIYYLPHFLYSVFLISFLTNCKIKQYYRIDCKDNNNYDVILDSKF